MSAYYGIVYGDRVELLTDGVIYSDAGTVIEVREKVWRSEKLPLAFAGRGNALAIRAVEMLLQASEGATVDATLDTFQRLLRDRPRLRETAIDGIIACIKDDGEPCLRWFTTLEIDGVEPLTLYDVGPEFGGGPDPSSETLALYGFPERTQTETLAECGADLFEAIRRTPLEHLGLPGRPVFFGVGGHVDMTTIDASGSRTTRLRTWPDDVPGKAITPAT